MSGRPRALELLDFALIAAAFWGVFQFFIPSASRTALDPEPLWSVIVPCLTFWIAIQLQDRGPSIGLVNLFVGQFCLGTGMNMVVQAVLAYILLLTYHPLLLPTQGAVASALLCLARITIREEDLWRPGTLIVGDGPLDADLMANMYRPILGTVGTSIPGIPALGEIDDLPEIVSRTAAGHIFVNSSSRVLPSASVLMNLRLRRISVDNTAALYEKCLGRVWTGQLHPTGVVLSPSLYTDSRTMAIQSVYTNLIGLSFLLAASPLIILLSLLVAIFSGPGPVFETVECVGFQKIPFRLLRFRTRSRGSRKWTRIGRFIANLHLEDLPQLINVVRGEMALFGPGPVRKEFSNRLTALVPSYSHRFSVKPGLLGWAQLNLRETEPANDLQRLEYDLFYIKTGSPLFDVEILLRSLGGFFRRRSSIIVPAADSPGSRS